MDMETIVKGIQECDLNGGLIGNCPYKGILAMLKEDCHNCKLECLLQKYDQLKEKHDKLLKEQTDEIKELRSMVEFWKEKALHT